MASPQVPPSPAAVAHQMLATPTPPAPSCPNAQPARTKAAPEGAAALSSRCQCGSAARGTRHTRPGPRRPSGYPGQLVRSAPPKPNSLEVRVRPQASPRTRTASGPGPAGAQGLAVGTGCRLPQPDLGSVIAPRADHGLLAPERDAKSRTRGDG